MHHFNNLSAFFELTSQSRKLSFYLIGGIIFSLNNSATPIIERDKIRTTKFKKGLAGFSRPRFEVIFENEKGKRKKRLIMLPGTLAGGIQESKKALKIMQEEGFIENR